jgi:hypothetical protein
MTQCIQRAQSYARHWKLETQNRRRRIDLCCRSRIPPLHNEAKDACDHRYHAHDKQDYREVIDVHTNDELMLQDAKDSEDRSNGDQRDS